jgi:hypothetical protein
MLQIRGDETETVAKEESVQPHRQDPPDNEDEMAVSRDFQRGYPTNETIIKGIN